MHYPDYPGAPGPEPDCATCWWLEGDEESRKIKNKMEPLHTLETENLNGLDELDGLRTKAYQEMSGYELQAELETLAMGEDAISKRLEKCQEKLTNLQRQYSERSAAINLRQSELLYEQAREQLDVRPRIYMGALDPQEKELDNHPRHRLRLDRDIYAYEIFLY